VRPIEDGTSERSGPGAQALVRAMGALAIALTLAACTDAGAPRASAARGGAGRCAAPPVGIVEVFLEGGSDSGAQRFSGELTASLPASDLGFRRYAIRDADGHERRLAYRAPGDGPPLAPGKTYRFQVDQGGEAPHTGALLVWDASGLLFAAASDVTPGATVLRGGVPGFLIGLAPAGCASRSRSECIASATNLALTVRSGAKRATLLHGEEARLGAYAVRCLTAQRVVAAPRCADAAQHGIAYTITRVN